MNLPLKIFALYQRYEANIYDRSMHPEDVYILEIGLPFHPASLKRMINVVILSWA